MKCVALVLNICCGLIPLMADDPFPEPVNTQAAGEHPPTPREMLDLFDLPPGFQVSLFAGEPDVQQPIAFEFDDVGRIWVAENYSYGAHGKYDPNLRDRVIILHDKDGDGEHDERKVFWDRGWMLTGLTWGYGGLWILNDGTLSFIPDRDGDDVPDSEPVEMLNGWTKGAGHNVVNGLLWGPDGWLYGRHGITDTSLPGTPDTPASERSPMNCGIWRFHPVKHQFEIVCHGTTNPWGLDYNADGDLFMSNNVIGHLWHVIPGAHYERMFGQDFNPHLYELMPQTADHYHWDDTGKWNESRDGAADHLGGGHSHCGLMIYQETHFPEQYRGRAFMCNTHGRCINVDRLERQGSSYVAKHEPNFLKVNTPWFRGVTIKSGPAGCVYLSDWSDNGECHDHDGVHRTSGRIYRISYGDPTFDIPAWDEASLVKLAGLAVTPEDRGEWTARRARRLLQERFPDAPADQRNNLLQLRKDFWSLKGKSGRMAKCMADIFFALDAFDDGHLHRALIAPNEQIRRTALKYVCDNPESLHRFSDLIDSWIFNYEQDPTVLLTYAGAIQKLHLQPDQPADLDFPSLSGIAKLCRVCDGDRDLQLMTWYALESFNRSQPAKRMLPPTFIRDGKVRGFQVRWLASQWQDHGPQVLATLQDWPDLLLRPAPKELAIRRPVEETRQLLQGVLASIEGQILPRQNFDWNQLRPKYAALKDDEVLSLYDSISATFGSPAALERLRTILKDRQGDHSVRTKAVRTLAEQRDLQSLEIFLSLLNDRAVYVDVAAGLANFDDPRIPAELLKRWDYLRHGAQEAAADTLVSRRSYAVELATALNDGTVTAQQLTATQVRQLISFNDPKITAAVEDKWGIINDSSAARSSSIERWKQALTAATLADADLSAGAALFRKSCANCHRMYGEGGKIGPDLTGSNRNNLDYLLSNIIDPSAVVPKQFTVSTIVLKSGRIVNGVVVAETNSTVSVQTDKELKVIPLADIDERVRTNKSLMPDGLLDPLSETQVRDLIAYLQHRR